MANLYSPEFKHNIVHIARLKEFPLTVIARSFGISTSTLQKWLKEDDVDDSWYKPVTFRMGEISEFLQAKEQLFKMHRIFDMQEHEMMQIREINIEVQYSVEIFASAIDFFAHSVFPDLPEIEFFLSFIESTYGGERVLCALGLVSHWQNAVRMYEKNDALVRRTKLLAALMDEPAKSTKKPAKVKPSNVVFIQSKKSSPGSHKKAENSALAEFIPEAPLELWVIDITQAQIRRCTFYIVFIMDVHSWEIVAHYISSRAPKTYPADIFEEVCHIHGCDPVEVRKNSAQIGPEHLSLVFIAAMQKKGIAPDFASKCSKTVNARVKGLLAPCHTEMVTNTYSHKNDDPVKDMEEYIDWYNDKRIHSSLGYSTPRKHQSQYYANANLVSVRDDSHSTRYVEPQGKSEVATLSPYVVPTDADG